MSSLMTNTSAMTALQTLRSVNANLATTQNRISTGYRVATASDNAAYWSIATTMRSDNMALSAVQDALGLGAATIDTMYTGLNSTVRSSSQIKSEAGCRPYARRRSRQDPERNHRTAEAAEEHRRSARSSTARTGSRSTPTSASYNATKSVVSSFSRVGGTVKIDTLSVNLDSIKLYDANLDTAYNAQAFPTVSTAAYAVATDVGGNITVTIGAAPAINIAVAAKTSLADIATEINKLNIDGLSVGVNTAGTMLSFKSRNDADIVINAAVSGLGAAVTLTALATPVDTKKGVLDQTFDAYTGAAWETVSVANAGHLEDHRQRFRPGEARDLHPGRRGCVRQDHRLGDQPRRDQEPHRPAAGLRQDPDGLARSRYRPARRRRHERRIRPACRRCRSSSSSASRRSRSPTRAARASCRCSEANEHVAS